MRLAENASLVSMGVKRIESNRRTRRNKAKQNRNHHIQIFEN